jgi:hypothetical protein
MDISFLLLFSAVEVESSGSFAIFLALKNPRVAASRNAVSVLFNQVNIFDTSMKVTSLCYIAWLASLIWFRIRCQAHSVKNKKTENLFDGEDSVQWNSVLGLPMHFPEYYSTSCTLFYSVNVTL